jgi:hypothetical protein
METAVLHLYDFSTGAGTNRWAYGSQSSNWSVLDGVRRPAAVGTELSGASYSALAASDDSRYGSPVPGFGAESTHIFEFTIEEDPARILDIGIHWEGYAADCTQAELYVWDDVAGQWCDGDGLCGENRFLDNFAGNRDGALEGHIRSGFDRYIGSGGILTLLLYAERSQDRTQHDYVAVSVAHEPCDDPDTDFDGYADACDNCPLAVNPLQENADGDALGDACDCAPGDGTVFAAPLEIVNVLFPDKTTLVWDSDAPNSGSGTVYDVLRGDVEEYPVGAGMAEICQENDLADTSVTGLPDPPGGVGQYYLVRGTNVCGTGTYGLDSDGLERDSAACP